MIAIPEMLVEPANQAGIKVPEDIDNYNPDEFPHWHVFLNVQIGISCPYPGCHWDNAEVSAKIEEYKIRNIRVSELIALGFV